MIRKAVKTEADGGGRHRQGSGEYSAPRAMPGTVRYGLNFTGTRLGFLLNFGDVMMKHDIIPRVNALAG
jgi:hypothetical protein